MPAETDRAATQTTFNGRTLLDGRAATAFYPISARRSRLGAVQNRLESTINHLTFGSENLQAARSRILDADYAAEVAALICAQILQQAGIAILAQANQAPQLVLRLLG